MTTDPLRRRYGYGAARLPIGHVEGGVSLARIARTRSRFERPFASSPGLACVAVALLLVWATHLQIPSHVAVEATTLEVRLWDEIAASSIAPVAVPVPDPVSDPVNEGPAPLPEQAAEQLTEVASEHVFDPSSLALGAPSAAPVDFDSAPRPSQPNPSSTMRRSQRPGQQGSKALRPSLALAALDAPAIPASVEEATPMRVAGSGAPRPKAASGSSPDEMQEWKPTSGRHDFLTSVLADDSLGGDAGSTTERERPPVAAGPHRPEIADSIRSNLETAATHGRPGRWQEVPLDELPDCTPIGRQDALKKRILLAAPFNRECSHPDGSYRFVETRNLNAFLMWSRPNPDALSGRRRDRDACDVLERALQCLGETSIEESSAR